MQFGDAVEAGASVFVEMAQGVALEIGQRAFGLGGDGAVGAPPILLEVVDAEAGLAVEGKHTLDALAMGVAGQAHDGAFVAGHHLGNDRPIRPEVRELRHIGRRLHGGSRVVEAELGGAGERRRLIGELAVAGAGLNVLHRRWRHPVQFTERRRAPVAEWVRAGRDGQKDVELNHGSPGPWPPAAVRAGWVPCSRSVGPTL